MKQQKIDKLDLDRQSRMFYKLKSTYQLVLIRTLFIENFPIDVCNQTSLFFTDVHLDAAKRLPREWSKVFNVFRIWEWETNERKHRIEQRNLWDLWKKGTSAKTVCCVYKDELFYVLSYKNWVLPYLRIWNNIKILLVS